jgi:hypothetical protein
MVKYVYVRSNAFYNIARLFSENMKNVFEGQTGLAA